jgi:predicted nucleic acid-binding protein
MKDKVFLDTNVRVYCIDTQDEIKRHKAIAITDNLFLEKRLILSTQSINEAYRVLTIKKKLPRQDIQRFLTPFLKFATAPYTTQTITYAFDIEAKTRYQWFDCLLLASAALANSTFFFSEDMSSETQIGAMRLVNPFT